MAIQTAADNQVTVLSASWNNGSTAYTAFKVDVNNILTPPTSRLFDVGTNTGTYSSRFSIDVSGSMTSAGSMLLGTTRQMQLFPDYSGNGELLAGAYISSVGNNAIFMIPSSNGFTGAAATAGIGYYSNSPTAWWSAVQVSNVASGFGNLLLMRSGGNVGIGTTNPTGVLHISGSSTAATPTALIRHGVANGSSSPILQIQNSAGSNVLFVSASGDIGINGTPTNFASYNYLTHYGRSTTLGGVFQSRTSDSSFDAQFYVDNGGGAIASNVLRFFTNSLERMRIDNSGIVYVGGVTTQLASESVRIGRASVQNSLLLNNTAVDNAAIVGVFNDAAALAVNRNSSTGGFVNTGKYAAELYAVGTTSTSYVAFATANAANTGPTERVRIDATGNVGVGITNPGYKLDVVGQIKARNLASGDTTGITLGSSGTERARIQFTASDDSARFKIEVNGVNAASERISVFAGPLGGVASNEALVIGGNGNVGIGTGTLVTARLLVTGSGATSSTTTAHFVNSSGTSLLFVRDDGNVGLGSSSPAQLLDVNGVINAGTGYRVGNATPTAGNYLRSNGSNFIAGTIQVSDVPTLNQNTAGYAGSLLADDNRTIAPNEYSTNRLNFGFTGYNNTNAPPYADFLHLASYIDSSGGRENLLMFNKSSLGMRLWQSAGFGTSAAYSTYKDIVLAENSPIANYVLKYSGTGNSVSAANSNIFDNGTNVGIGTTTSMTSAFTVHSGVDGVETAVVDVTGAAGSIGVGKFIRFVGGPGVGWTNNYSGGAGLWLGAGTSTKTLYIGTAGTYSGNVGINSTLPTNLLTVNQASNTAGATVATYGFMLSNQGTTRLSIGSDASYGLIQTWNNLPLLINNQGNNILLGGSTSGPNTGIGVGVVSARLHVQGSTTTTTPTLLIRESQAMANATAALDVQNSSNTSLFFVSGSGFVGIGTNTQFASDNLQIGNVSTSGARSIFLADNGWGLRISAGGGSSFIQSTGVTVPLQFYAGTSNNGNYLFTSTGNFGIGAGTNLTAKLLVTGSGTGTGATAHFVNSSGTSLLFVRDDANIGIGTTTPVARLHINGSSASSPCLVLPDSTNARFSVGFGNMNVAGVGQRLDFYAGDSGNNSSNLGASSLRMSLTSTGMLGIGTTDPLARLHVSGSATASDQTVLIRAGTASQTGPVLEVENNIGTTLMVVSGSGNVGIGLTNPSNKLVVTTSTQFDGIFLTNSGGFTPARLVGTTASNDGGALILRNVSTDTVTINGNGNSYFNSSNVGIGTNSPATKLDVWGYTRIGNYGGTFQGLTVLNNNNSALLETVSFVDFQNDLGVTDSNVFAGHATNGSSYLALGTTPAGSRSSDRRAERVRINGDGRVGIGTASPATYLHMHVTASLDGMLLTDGSRFIRMMAGTAGAGAYNNIVLPNDHVLIFSGSKATLSQEGFVIAPWDNTVGAGVTSGLRMNPSGSVSIGASTSSGRFFVSGSGNSNETVAVLKSGTPTATRVLDVQNVAGNSILSVFPTPTVNVPGAVGINTTPSNGVLEVYGGAGNVYTVSNAGSNVVAGFSGITNSSSTSAISIFSIDTTNGVLIGSQTAQNASLITSNTIGLTLDTSQRTGVGTTTISTARMHVQGTSTGSDTTLRVRHNVANGSNLPVLDVQNSAGTSLLFVSGSGRVGIGSTSPGAPLDIVGGSTSAPVFPSLRLRQSVNNGYGFIQLGDSSTNSNNWHIGSEGDGRFLFYNGAFGSGTERLRLTNSTGDLTIATGNLVIGTAGKGIDFGATPPASSGSLGQELFDDYEEGAFTPGLAVGGGGSITTSTAAGTYTKMGRVVVCRFFFEASAVSGTRNTLQITGFPFQMDVTYANCFLELYNLNNAATGLTGNFAHGVGWASVPSNRLNVSIYLRTSGTPLGGLNETPANAFQANTIMAGVVTYFTNQ